MNSGLTGTSIRRKTVGCALAWSLVGAAWVSAASPVQEPVSQLVRAEKAEECPHEWVWTPAQNANIKEFTGGRDDVPEYNDCQRFFLEGSAAAPAYTKTVFAIFAAESVSDVLPTLLPPRSPVALIRAGEAYAPLGITDEHVFYCLSLTPRTGLNGILWVAGPNADCNTPGERIKRLWVHRRAPGSAFGPGSVPGVVRWGFDGIPARNERAGNWVQYAIVPCGEDVCYVGPTNEKGTGPGFTPKPPAQILASISPGLPGGGRVRQIDGWHDTQYLADPSSPSTPADSLVGSLIPDPALATRTTGDFKLGWIRVAEVAMSGSGYEAKYNFSPTLARSYNTIDACVYFSGDEGTGNCERLVDGTPQPLPPSMGEECAKYDRSVLRWRTRHINAARTDTTYHCIELKPFPPVPDLVVPGTARWKWVEQDEKAWFRCPEGCCLIQD